MLYAGGDCGLHLSIMLLAIGCSLRDVRHVRHICGGALDMHTGIGPADWCARGSDIAGGWKVSLVGRSVNLELSTGADVFVI